MYICNSCGAVFSEPELVEEQVGSFMDSPYYEQRLRCPECGGSYHDVRKCHCGEQVSDGVLFCELCAEVLRRRFARLMNDNFTVDEQEYVLDYSGQALAEKEAV